MSVKAGYWGYWLRDQSPIESIPSNLFTHLFCAFAVLDKNSNKVTLPSGDFARFTEVVRRRNGSVKTLLSIGGGGPNRVEIENAFAAMAANGGSRRIFISSCIEVARANRFDGIDLDYEYPKSQAQMNDLGTLLRELRQEVENDGRRLGRPPLILTAAVRYRNTNYEATADPYPPEVNELDWINVMSYDLWTADSWAGPNTGPSAPLRDPTGQGVSAIDGINAWINQGRVPRKKIVLGIPFYGYRCKLINPNIHGFGAPRVTGDNNQFPESGYITYKRIMADYSNAVEVYDEQRVASYRYLGEVWITFDNKAAVIAKVNYVRDAGLLGYFAWDIPGDDQAFTLSTAANAVPLPA